jgi:glycosyltransferase involved in cell wall biosynthesis
MKIAIVSTMQIYPWGGSEELWYNTAVKAKEQGYEVDCFVYDHAHKPAKHLALQAMGIELFYIPIVKGRFAGLRKKVQLNPYKRLQQEKYAKIIISQGGTFELFSNQFLLDALETINGENIIIVSHGNQNGLLLTAEKRELAKAFFTRVKQVCFISNWAIQLTESQILHKLSNAIIVFNPYKQVLFQSNTILPVPLKMAMVSSLSIQWKGQDILLEVLASDHWKKRDWQLEIYGEGHDQLYIMNLIHFYELQHNVKLMGHENDLSVIWNHNSILLIPSRVDNVPISLIEAMACSRTALVTAIGGMTEWIDDTTGFIAEGPTTKALEKALEKMWLKRDTLMEMGQKCALRVQEKTNNQTFDLLHLI